MLKQIIITIIQNHLDTMMLNHVITDIHDLEYLRAHIPTILVQKVQLLPRGNTALQYTHVSDWATQYINRPRMLNIPERGFYIISGFSLVLAGSFLMITAIDSIISSIT